MEASGIQGPLHDATGITSRPWIFTALAARGCATHFDEFFEARQIIRRRGLTSPEHACH